MRLLDTRTFKFEEFVEDDIPPYAILSHTWGTPHQELTFRDMIRNPDGFREEQRYGATKIVNTCYLASRQGLAYAWVDTCCIDKSSSAELTEAINSMFRWYEKASICYIHLADVGPETDLQEGLKHCRWLTRGWTLQELIAPQECYFFDNKWNNRGRKTELKEMLSALTKVPSPVLAKEKLPKDYPVAQRMSWAARRQTTRREDLAYCLLGLFGIHMPMLYGEGMMAFHRLQEAIIARTDDMTIFAWDPADGDPEFVSIFAPSPAAFEGYREVVNAAHFHPTEFSLTNKGVKLVNAVILVPSQRHSFLHGHEYILQLREDTTSRQGAGIYLRKINEYLFCRTNRPVVARSQLESVHKVKISEIYLADFCNSLITPNAVLDSRRAAIQILPPRGFQIQRPAPGSLWDQEDSCFLLGSGGAHLVQWVKLVRRCVPLVELIMLCRRDANNGSRAPDLSVFERQQFEKHYDFILQNGGKYMGDNLNWKKIKEELPALLKHTSSTDITLQDRRVLTISVSVARTTASIREGDIEMYQASFEATVRSTGQGEGCHVNGPS